MTWQLVALIILLVIFGLLCCLPALLKWADTDPEAPEIDSSPDSSPEIPEGVHVPGEATHKRWRGQDDTAKVYPPFTHYIEPPPRKPK